MPAEIYPRSACHRNKNRAAHQRSPTPAGRPRQNADGRHHRRSGHCMTAGKAVGSALYARDPQAWPEPGKPCLAAKLSAAAPLIAINLKVVSALQARRQCERSTIAHCGVSANIRTAPEAALAGQGALEIFRGDRTWSVGRGRSNGVNWYFERSNAHIAPGSIKAALTGCRKNRSYPTKRGKRDVRYMPTGA